MIIYTSNFVGKENCCVYPNRKIIESAEDLITPEKFCEILPDVCFAIVSSRNDGKPKGNRPVRPRFHVYFPVEKIFDAEIYANLKKNIQKKFPFFDENALDAARFIFGNSAEKIIWHEGEITIDCLFAKQKIPEGQRNNTLSRFAGRVVKRYGTTEKAHEIFLTQAEKCEPPLDDEELQKIWQSACRFAEKIQTQDGYISPEIFNSDFQSLKPPDYSDIGQAKALEESGISAEIVKAGGKNLQKNISTSAQIKIFENYLSAIAYKNFVMKRRDMKFVISALQAAKPMLEISPLELDKENFLLNCPDGTYDLNFGMAGRREHRAEDFITKITAVSPSDKRKNLWLSAIEKFFCRNFFLQVETDF